MGTTLSTKIGFGIRLPWGEDDDTFDFDTDFYGLFFDPEEIRDDYSRPDLYEVAAQIEKQYPLLEIEQTYYRDYSSDAVLFIKSTVTNHWDAGVFPISEPEYPHSEYVQLRQAAILLGVGSSVSGWLVAVAYG